MTQVCYNKPNRTKVRHFTGKDVERIAGYAIRDGADPRDVLIRVVAAAGLLYVLCAASKAVNSIAAIASLLAKIGGILAVAKFMDFLLTVVTNRAFLKLPIVKRYAALIILAVSISEGILGALRDLLDNATVITGAADEINELCRRSVEFVKDRANV